MTTLSHSLSHGNPKIRSIGKKLDLVGISEIGEMLGVSRQRVDKLSRTAPEFPEPVAEIRAGRIWLESEVQDWMKRVGRDG